MRFAIMGSGAVGGCLGVRLAADGNEVIFIDRGRQREAIEAGGLKLLAPEGELRVHPATVHRDPVGTGFCDFVLFCVAPQDTEAAARIIAPLLAHDSAILCLQHGIEGTARLRAIFGDGFVLGGFVELAAEQAAPGVVRQRSRAVGLVFGELDGVASWRQECLLAACQSAGIDTRVSPDVWRELWQHFVLEAALAAADPPRERCFEAMMAEGLAVAAAHGVSLGAEVVANAGAAPAARVQGKHTPAREALALLEAMLRMAERVNVPVPAYAQAHHAFAGAR